MEQEYKPTNTWFDLVESMERLRVRMASVENSRTDGFNPFLPRIGLDPSEPIISQEFLHGQLVRPNFSPRHSGMFIERDPASAEEIHQYLNLESESELSRAKRVMEYKRIYPSNAFITHQQVGQICRKYNLAFAPDFMFVGDIPEKNQQERAAFKLKDKHDSVRVNAADSVLTTGFSGRNIEAAIDFPEDNIDAPLIVGLGLESAVIFNCGLIGLREWMELPMHRSQPMAATLYFKSNKVWVKSDLGRLVDGLTVQIKVNKPDVRFRGLTDRFEFQRRQIKFDFFVNRDRLYRPITISRTTSAAQMVICPPDMLSKDMPIFLEGGWDAKFSPSGRSVEGRGYDPIILQPVEGGYLVVTKWGDEAKIEAFQSPQEN